MLKNLIVGILEGIARVVRSGREAFGKTVEEIGQDIRKGALIPDEAFNRAKKDGEILDDLYNRKG